MDGVGFCGAGANGVEFGEQGGSFGCLFFGDEFADGFFDLADGSLFGDVARLAAQGGTGVFGVGSDVWHSPVDSERGELFSSFFPRACGEKKLKPQKPGIFFLRNFSKQAGCLIFEERGAGYEGAKVVVVYFRRSCDDDDRYDTR